MAENQKWYKNSGVIITMALAITPVILSQSLDVYFDIINSPTDFQVCLDSVNIGTENALIEAPSTPGGTPIMVIYNESRIIARNCHRINPYDYEIFLRVVDEPDCIEITFEPNVLRLPDNYLSTIHAKISSDISSGNHPIEIEAVGGDGTKHNSYCIITVEKNYELDTKGYRMMVDVTKDVRAPTDVGDANATSLIPEVSQDQDLRPAGDVREVEVTQQVQSVRPTGSVR